MISIRKHRLFALLGVLVVTLSATWWRARSSSPSISYSPLDLSLGYRCNCSLCSTDTRTVCIKPETQEITSGSGPALENLDLDTRGNKQDEEKSAPEKVYWRGRSRTSRETVSRIGSGVLMFGYGAEKKSAVHFARMAVDAALTFKRFSPELKMAIVSNLKRSDFDEGHVFDVYIPIREDHEFDGSNYQGRSDNISRQWLTRLLYLSATPFELTIAYDANVLACADILPAIRQLQSSSFDFAVASAGDQKHNNFQPHNFALAFRWNEVVAKFLDEWFMEQVSTGVALDDQHTLRKSGVAFAAREPHFRFRVLNPVLATAYVSTHPTNGFYPRETRVIRGEALVIHDHPKNANATCEYFNLRSTARQIVFDGKKKWTVHSATECETKLNLTTGCKYAELWDAAEDQLVPKFM